MWALSLILESWLVVSIALFAALTMRSGVSTVLASLAIYTLSRMMGFFLATTKSGMLFKEHQINSGATWLLTGISTLVPRLDFFAKSGWLIYGPKSYDDVTLVLLQAGRLHPPAAHGLRH
ncbi:MAG: hypothetical protein WDN72_08235 [Alphaproteobacteria bacterium]